MIQKKKLGKCGKHWWHYNISSQSSPWTHSVTDSEEWYITWMEWIKCESSVEERQNRNRRDRGGCLVQIASRAWTWGLKTGGEEGAGSCLERWQWGAATKHSFRLVWMSSKMGNYSDSRANQATDTHTCVPISFSHTYTAKSHLVSSLKIFFSLKKGKVHKGDWI